MDRASRKEIKKAKKEAKEQMKAARKAGRKKLNKKDKKGILLIIVLFVVSVALAYYCMNIDFGDNIAEANINLITNAPMNTETTAPVVEQTTTQQATVTTVPSEENVPSTDSPSADIPSTENSAVPEQTAPSTENAAPTDAEILAAITEAVNSLKSDTANFKGSQVQVVNIWVTDCSVPSLTGTVNKVLEAFAGEDVYDFEFVNGKAMDPEEGVEVTGNEVFPPDSGLFSLTLDGVASASVSENEKGTVYSVTLVPETGTLENPRPPHHNSASDILDLSTVNIPMGEIVKADFNYPGAVITVTIDGNGKVVEYHERLDMNGTGEGKIVGVTGTADIEGYIDEKWTIQWK